MSPRDLYLRVIKVVSFFLQHASHLTIDSLKEFDPDVGTLARELKMLTNVLQVVASNSFEDQNLSINAMQCCVVMTQIATIVREDGSQEDLEALLKQLEMLTDVPH